MKEQDMSFAGLLGNSDEVKILEKLIIGREFEYSIDDLKEVVQEYTDGDVAVILDKFKSRGLIKLKNDKYSLNKYSPFTQGFIQAVQFNLRYGKKEEPVVEKTEKKVTETMKKKLIKEKND